MKIQQLTPLKVQLCSECDFVSEIEIKNKGRSLCPRCGSTFDVKGKSKSAARLYSISGLMLLLMSVFIPFLTMNTVGIVTEISLFDVLFMLYQNTELFLATILLCLVFLFPFLLLLIQTCLLWPRFGGAPFKKTSLVIYTQLQSWALPEIFMAGVLVSFIKLTSYGTVSFGLGFFSFAFFIFVYLKSTLCFPRLALWHDLGANNYVEKPILINQTAKSQQIRSCHCCAAILPQNQKACLRCGILGASRFFYSWQQTAAFVISAAILYFPANIFPVMETTFLGASEGSTILDGVIYMFDEGDYPVALIILCASILIPLLKITGLLCLLWICHSTKITEIEQCKKWTKIYHAIEIIGKWSMIDVFVVVLLTALINDGQLVAVTPDLGVYFFASVVIITMIASKKFDPRLIWDRKISAAAPDSESVAMAATTPETMRACPTK